MPIVSVKAEAEGAAARMPMKEVNESFIVVACLIIYTFSSSLNESKSVSCYLLIRFHMNNLHKRCDDQARLASLRF